MSNPIDTFTPELRAKARQEYGVLVAIEIDGRAAVDPDLGKRHIRLTFAETGNMTRTKQLRDLIRSWMEEDQMMLPPDVR